MGMMGYACRVEVARWSYMFEGEGCWKVRRVIDRYPYLDRAIGDDDDVGDMESPCGSGLPKRKLNGAVFVRLRINSNLVEHNDRMLGISLHCG